MARSLFRRYIWLVDTIRNAKDGVTFEQINEKWKNCSLNDTGEELSKRTFRNWINALPEAIGVLVECDRKYPYKYNITSADLDYKELMEWSINAFSMGSIMSENKSIRDRIMLEEIPSANETLSVICSAMRNNHEIWMEYKAFNKDHCISFETKPYALKLSDRRWYLIAHNDSNDKEYTYGLDRITGVKELDKSFVIDKGYSVKRQFANCIGIHCNDEQPVETIRIRVTGYLRDYIETLPIHQSQEIEEKTEDYTIFRFQLVQNYELIDSIAGLGDGCEVLEPLSLREKIREKAEIMAKLNE